MLVGELAGLVLPSACAGCGAGRVVLCGVCRSVLSGALAGPVRPSPCPAGLPAVYAATAYREAVRGVVLAHKERGALPLAGVLGAALAAAVRAGGAGDGGVVLVPVPSARHRVRARGHALPAQRRENLAGALEARPGAGRVTAGAARIVIVDDLVTTGSTLVEAARALRAAGIGPPGGVVVAPVVAAVVAAPADSFVRPGPVATRTEQETCE